MAEKKAARPRKAALNPANNAPVPDSTKTEYVAWLLDPDRSPRTQKEWAAEHGLHEVTVSRWRHDEYVIALLKRAADMLEPVWARVLATLVKIATDSDHIQAVQAARELGKLLGKYPSEKLTVETVTRVAYVDPGALRSTAAAPRAN